MKKKPHKSRKAQKQFKMMGRRLGLKIHKNKKFLWPVNFDEVVNIISHWEI